MTRKEIINFVENLKNEGYTLEEAINKLAILLDNEIPINPNLYYQQKIGGE